MASSCSIQMSVYCGKMASSCLSCVIQTVDLQCQFIVVNRTLHSRPVYRAVDRHCAKNIFKLMTLFLLTTTIQAYLLIINSLRVKTHLLGTLHANKKYLASDEKNAFLYFSELGGRSQMKDHPYGSIQY